MAEEPRRLLFEIDAICERFEAALRGAEGPRIEDFLGEWQGERRSALFQHLLELDWDYHSRSDDLRVIDDYRRRFPEHHNAIMEVIHGSSERDSPLGDAEPSMILLAAHDAAQPHLGDYEILREIGRGGMGVVYEARQRSLDRTVALKILPIHAARDSLARERFRREAKTAARLHHTNIVPVFDVGEDGETFYYAMQFIEAQSLDQICKRAASARLDTGPDQGGRGAKPSDSGKARIPTASAGDGADTSDEGDPARRSPRANLGSGSSAADLLDLTRSHGSHGSSTRPYTRAVAHVGLHVAGALAYAHGRGVIHRDIKPANLLIDGDGIVWVADFGLAKTEDEGLTRTGDVVGTIRYMSPERFTGRCDERGDIYGLGATLYELLTLRPAFDTSDRVQLIEEISNRTPTPPRALDPRIPRDLETIILKALDKDPRRRYQSARALADDLRCFLDDRPIRARRASPAERLASWSRKNKRLAAALFSVAILLIGTTIGSLVAARMFRRQEEQQRQLALQQAALRLDADAARDEARENLYYAQMNLAANTVNSMSGVAQLRDLVEPWAAQSKQKDMRGWEWFLFHAVGRSERRIIDLGEDCASIAWSPDRRHIATAGSGGVHVWATDGAGSATELRADLGFVNSLAWSRNGGVVAAADEGGRVVIWDGESRALVSTLKRCERGGRLSLAPDGHMLAFHGWDRTIRVTDLNSGRDVAVLTQDVDSPTGSCGFSPDGRFFAAQIHVADSSTWDVRIWETSRWREAFTLHGHGSFLTALAWSPNGRRLATGMETGEIWIWDLETRTTVQRTRATGHVIPALDWSPDGTRLVSGSWGFALQVWNPDTGEETALLRGHTAAIEAIAWNPDGRNVASAGKDGSLRLWDMTRPPPISSLDLKHQTRDNPYVSLAWDRAGARLATSFVNQGTTIWDARRWEATDTIQGVAASWSNDNRYLVSTYRENIMVWDQTLKKKVRDVVLIGQPKALVWNPRNSNRLAIRVGKALWIWDVSLGAEPTKVVDDLDEKGCLAWRPDGRLLATTRLEGERWKVLLWDPDSAKPVATLDGSARPLRSLAWSLDSHFLAVAGADALIRIWEASTWREAAILRGNTFTVNSVAWHPDGHRLASASADGSLKVWDPRSGKQTMSQQLPGGVRSVAWAGDGTRLAAVCDTGIVWIWDATMGYAAEASSNRTAGP